MNASSIIAADCVLRSQQGHTTIRRRMDRTCRHVKHATAIPVEPRWFHAEMKRLDQEGDKAKYEEIVEGIQEKHRYERD